MTRAEAGKLIDRLLGGYPSLNLHDPKTYISSVVSLFCSYPMWAGEYTVRKVHATSKFVPTIAEIKPILDDQVRVLRDAAEQNERLAREDQLRLAPPTFERPTMAELKAKYGPNWGLKTMSDDHAKRSNMQRETVQRANAKLFAEECERAGMPADSNVSPALLKLIREQNTTRDEMPADCER